MQQRGSSLNLLVKPGLVSGSAHWYSSWSCSSGTRSTANPASASMPSNFSSRRPVGIEAVYRNFLQISVLLMLV